MSLFPNNYLPLPESGLQPKLLMMKKLKISILLLLLFNATVFSQIRLLKIINFTVRNQLPAVIDNWNNTPGSLLLIAQKPPGINVEGARLVLQIRSGGSLICGNNAANGMPVDNFTTRSFTVSELTGILSGCHDLKEGSYTICAQFFNLDKVAISNEVCKEFSVESPREIDYALPTLITPENGKIFSSKELERPVMFRWTPIVPKPRETITYRLNVWQLLQGQNGLQAIKANQPIVSKDIDNITQVIVTKLLADPCKPPYFCSFIWNVQALNKEGKYMGRNNGTSEPHTFKVANGIDIQIDSVFVSCCLNGIQNFYINIKNNLGNTVKITQLKIDQVNGFPNNPGISGLSPALPVNIAGFGSQSFTGQIKCIDTAKTIRFFVAAQDAIENAITETEVATDTLKCACDACNDKHFSIKVPIPSPISWNNNSISFNQSITIVTTPPKTIKTIIGELVYFEMIPDEVNCIPCNKDATAYGHFANGTNAMQWNGAPPSLNIAISTPGMVACCSALFRWCIRYKIVFTDCTTCNKIVCYEMHKEGCTNPNPDQNKKILNNQP